MPGRKEHYRSSALRYLLVCFSFWLQDGLSCSCQLQLAAACIA